MRTGLWSRKAPTKLAIGLMKFFMVAISDVIIYRLVVCLISGWVMTSSSKSPMASWYATETGIAKSIIPSIIACISIEASQERRRIVSGVASLVRRGVSISSADDSKNEITVLSAQILAEV